MTGLPATAIIVQARVGSSRLPGKVLKPLAGETVLSQVLRRCHAVGVDAICCATTDLAADDPVAAEADRCGALVYRGSSEDVLGRYRSAADEIGCDIVMRITADCPVIDPVLCNAVLELRARRNADYATNNLPRTWPHGLDCEAFTFDLLCRADASAIAPDAREHVTTYMRECKNAVRVNLTGPGTPESEQRWTLDYPEDYTFFSALYAALPRSVEPCGWQEIYSTIASNPELAALQSKCRAAAKV